MPAMTRTTALGWPCLQSTVTVMTIVCRRMTTREQLWMKRRFLDKILHNRTDIPVVFIMCHTFLSLSCFCIEWRNFAIFGIFGFFNDAYPFLV